MSCQIRGLAHRMIDRPRRRPMCALPPRSRAAAPGQPSPMEGDAGAAGAIDNSSGSARRGRRTGVAGRPALPPMLLLPATLTLLLLLPPIGAAQSAAARAAARESPSLNVGKWMASSKWWCL